MSILVELPRICLSSLVNVCFPKCVDSLMQKRAVSPRVTEFGARPIAMEASCEVAALFASTDRLDPPTRGGNRVCEELVKGLRD